MAFMATALAIPFAFLLSFFAAKNMMRSPAAFFVYTLLRTLLNLSRSIEALIWAIIFSVWVGIGPFAGMLALMVHSVASLTKQYSEIVESVSDGPIEGILATGANKIQMVWFAVVPQIILPYISFTVYRWDINIRMATIIGFVGGGGIGTLLIQYQGQAMWHEVGTIVLVIAFVVWFMDTASAYLREALK
jgi:phosphonate transport system permease protein